MDQQQQPPRNADIVFSKKVKAGRRRTYFVDVRATRGNDYYLTITESKRRPDDSFEKHKVFIYKEDFNKFLAGLNEAMDKVKNELMPDFDFTQFDRPEYDDYNNPNAQHPPYQQPQGGEPNYNRGDFGNESFPQNNNQSYNDTNQNIQSPTPQPDNLNTGSDDDLKW